MGGGVRVTRALYGLSKFATSPCTRNCRAISNVADKYIIRSTRPTIAIPQIPLHELVWYDINKWADKIALECAVTGKKYTYAQARKISASLAAALQNKFKLAPGDCFAILSPNSPEYPLLLLAAAEAGLVATTINPLYSPDEVAKQLKDSQSKAIFTVPLCHLVAASASQKIAADIPIVVIKEVSNIPTPPGTIVFEDFLDSPGPLRRVNVNLKKDNLVLPYSSGTTGLPKGVQLTHFNLVSNVVQVDVPRVRLLLETTAEQQDNVLGLLPMFHIYGMVVVALTTLQGGGKLITLPKFDPKLFVQSMVQHKTGLLYLVPPLILFLADHPEVKRQHLSYIRAINSGAAPIGLADIERFVRKAPQAMMNQGYGMTETSPVALMSHRDRLHKYSSTGVPLSNTEVKVVDVQSGESLPPNKVGELLIRGPQVMKGYLNREDANQEIFCDGWLRTGDIASYDEEGDFYIVDRIKELIKVKGFQVAPAELEELLRSHPQIMDAAVIGVPDARSGEAPRAYVVPKAGQTLTEKKIQEFVAEKVSEFKRLTGGVEIVQAIPKSAAGKILRKELRAKASKSS